MTQTAADISPFARRSVTVWLNRFGPLLALLLVYAFFAVLTPKITQRYALERIASQTVIVGITAIGMTLVIIGAGIDLSVGSIIALGSVIAAQVLLIDASGQTATPTWPIAWPLVAACAAVAGGAACGCFCGLLITRLRVAPFIVTLGMLLVVRGLAKGMADSRMVNPPQTWLGALLGAQQEQLKWTLLPPGVWLMFLLTLAAAALLRYTRLGRHIFAVGSNEQTARLCGVAVNGVKLFIYTASGAAAGLGGLMLLSRQGQGDPTAAQGYELDVIAAVVIGGGSLSGGEGSVFGSLVGALIMTIIRMGCTLKGWDPYVQQIVTGAIIVVAVALDRWRHRRA